MAQRENAHAIYMAVLLFNLVVNHIFIFLMALTLIKVSSIPIILMAVIFFSLLGYIMISAKRSLNGEPSWFIRCHWQFAAKRARLFLILFLVLGTISVVFFYGGHAMGLKNVAITAFPSILGSVFMVAVLGLVVIEFDAEHQARNGKIPASAIAYYPPPGQAGLAGRPQSGGSQNG